MASQLQTRKKHALKCSRKQRAAAAAVILRQSCDAPTTRPASCTRQTYDMPRVVHASCTRQTYDISAHGRCYLSCEACIRGERFSLHVLTALMQRSELMHNTQHKADEHGLPFEIANYSGARRPMRLWSTFGNAVANAVRTLRSSRRAPLRRLPQPPAVHRRVAGMPLLRCAL